MSAQNIGIIVNLSILVLALIGTFVLVRKLKFDDNNSRIIFLLYIVYWISPLLCRDYTTSTHIHMGLSNAAQLMWIPVAVFGVIGILWRPLNDILTFKLKSRKLIIYLSLLVQLLTIFPYLLYPCFATNIIQSVGSGVGASGIGLFTLMFNENQKHHRKFLTISLFALPPIIAGFIVSAIESFVACYVPEKHTIIEYQSVVWYIWLIALIFILISFVIACFIKERRETLYQDKKGKHTVEKPSEHWQIILLCVCGMILTFVRWATAGPFAGMQMTYIANHEHLSNTNVWEGYLGLAYTFGALIGSIISALCIVKCKTKKYQPIVIAIAVILWLGYFGANAFSINVPVYFWTNIANGIGFGMVWNIFMQIILNRYYAKKDIVTPIGFFNMSLSIGLSVGAVFIGFTKAKYFDFHSETSLSWDEFVRTNYVTSVILTIVTVVMLLLFIWYWLSDRKMKHHRGDQKRSIAMIGENEI